MNCCGQGESHKTPTAPTCPIDPIAVEISDSIVDSASGLPAIYSNCCSPAHADLTVERSTILGDICVQQLTRAEDSLFAGIVHVQRRGFGFMRFCYLPTRIEDVPLLMNGYLFATFHHTRQRLSYGALGGATEVPAADRCFDVRTPPRFKCIPDSHSAKWNSTCSTGCWNALAIQPPRTSAAPIPVFVSTDYGQPGYCELSLACPPPILGGAEDESEVGAFHDLYRRQRDAAPRVRLQEYTPADMQSAVIYADDLHPAIFRRSIIN